MKTMNESAVSNIIGAVIFTALIVSTLVVVRVDYIPLLEEDREAQEMRNLASELTMMKSDIDRQVDDRLNLPMSSGVTVGRQGSTGFMRPVRVPGDVGFSMYPGASSFSLASPEILQQGGTNGDVQGVDEQWQTIVSGTVIENVSSISHLRVRVADPEGSNDGDALTLQITDANGAYAGKVVITYEDITSDYAMEVAVYSASSSVTPINLMTDSYKSNYQPAYYYRYLLDQNLLFAQVLEAAEKPMRLAMTNAGLTGDFVATYTQLVNGVETTVGGSGLTIPDFSRTASAGRMTVNAPNQYFPQQEYIYEYGGVILRQDGSEVMLVPPQFTIVATADTAQMELIVPTVTGSNTTSGGVPQYVVRSQPLGQAFKMQASMADMYWNLTTDHHVAWMGYWNDTLGAAGLSAASGHFSVSKTADGASLHLVGPKSNTDKDLYINLAQSRIGLTIRAAT